MAIYLDNAAAMMPFPDMASRFAELCPHLFANQESPVSGMNSGIADASRRIREAVCGRSADRYEVLFVNTGTDAVCAAFRAAEHHFRKGRIIFSGGEHASVRAAARRLEPDFQQTVIACGQGGLIDRLQYETAVLPDTVFAAVHLVQPETGVIQHPEWLKRVLNDRAPNALLFVDAIQGIGKVPFDFADVRPDLLALSGQKLGIPVGGALICRKDLMPIFRKIRFEEHRIGRLPPLFVRLLADAVEYWTVHFDECHRKAEELRSVLFRELERQIGGKFIRTVPQNADASPFITHLLLTDVKTKQAYQGAIVTRALSAEGIIAAPGSACDAETNEPSAALTWMKIPKELAFSALRISFSPWNDAGEIIILAETLGKILRQY